MTASVEDVTTGLASIATLQPRSVDSVSGTWWLAALLAVGVFYWYRRETASLSSSPGRSASGSTTRWARWLLPLLRTVTVLTVVLMWLAPVWRWRELDGDPGRLLVGIDTSGSMSIAEPEAESGTEGDRLARVIGRINGDAGDGAWLSPFLSRFWIDVWEFAEKPRLLWSDPGPSDAQLFGRWQSGDDNRQEAWKEAISAALTTEGGRGSDVSSLLQQWTDQVGGSDESNGTGGAAVGVVWTDGRVDQPAEALDSARRFAEAGGRLHVVGVGSAEEPADLALLDVLAPQTVSPQGRVRGELLVQATGYEGETVLLELTTGDRLVWSKQIVIERSGRQTVAFDVSLDGDNNEAGGMTDGDVMAPPYVLVRATIAPVDRKDSGPTTAAGGSAASERSENDQLIFPVVITSQRRRLLIVDSAPRWETRYLQNLFRRDPAWRVDTVWWMTGESPDADPPSRLPDSMDQWMDYDVVVWGELPVEVWTPANIRHLREFVQRGGGLIVLDGRYGQMPAMPSDLLPVRLSESSAAAGTSEQLQRQAAWPAVESIVPTPLGQSKNVIKLAVGEDDLVSWWRRLPAPLSIPTVEPAAGAEVWAEAVLTARGAAEVKTGEANGKNVRTPWLVTRRFGAGRVFYLATDQTWRWRRGVESRWHGWFWNQLMMAAMQPPFAVENEFLAIGTDKVQVNPGESASIRVRLRQPDEVAPYSFDPPAADSRQADRPEMTADGKRGTTTVDAILTGRDNETLSVPLTADGASGDRWVGQTPPLAEGEYRVSVRVPGYDQKSLNLFTSVRVDPRRSREWDRVSLDETFLRGLANAGGGMYVSEAKAESLWNGIQTRGIGQVVSRSFRWSESWWGFAMVAALLATEWWMRKRVGLV